MKKIMALMLAVTLVFASCSKEKKLNRKLDGEWTLSTIDGTSPTAGSSMKLKFEKDKKAGSYTLSLTYVGGSESETGTYTLTKDDIITFNPTTTGATTSVYVVNSYTKSELNMTGDGHTLVFKK